MSGPHNDQGIVAGFVVFWIGVGIAPLTEGWPTWNRLAAVPSRVGRCWTVDRLVRQSRMQTPFLGRHMNPQRKTHPAAVPRMTVGTTRRAIQVSAGQHRVWQPSSRIRIA